VAAAAAAAGRAAAGWAMCIVICSRRCRSWIVGPRSRLAIVFGIPALVDHFSRVGRRSLFSGAAFRVSDIDILQPLKYTVELSPPSEGMYVIIV